MCYLPSPDRSVMHGKADIVEIRIGTNIVGRYRIEEKRRKRSLIIHSLPTVSILTLLIYALTRLRMSILATYYP